MCVTLHRLIRIVPVFCFVVLAVALPSSVRAQLNVLESGFQVTHLASSSGPKQVECSPGGAWGPYVYVGDSGGGAIERIDILDSITMFSPTGLAFPVGLAFGPGPGGNFGEFIYVADYGDDTIKKVDTSGNVTTFAGYAAPGGIAFDPTGGYGNDLFVTTGFSGPMHSLDLAGTATGFSSLDATYIKFGPGGVWGAGMYATTYGGAGVGIATVDAAGVATSFAGGFVAPEGFDWAQGVQFAGDLFVTDFSTGEIWRVKSNGTRTLWATLPQVADVAFCSEALYVVSGNGECYKVTESPVPVRPSSWSAIKTRYP